MSPVAKRPRIAISNTQKKAYEPGFWPRKVEIKSPETPVPGRQSKITPARFFALIVI